MWNFLLIKHLTLTLASQGYVCWGMFLVGVGLGDCSLEPSLGNFLRMMTRFCWLLLSVTSSRHRGGLQCRDECWHLEVWSRGSLPENCGLPPLVGWWAPAPLCWTIVVERELSQKANFGFHHLIYVPVIVHTSGKCAEMSFLCWRFGGRPRTHWTEGCPEYPARPATQSFSQVLTFGNRFMALNCKTIHAWQRCILMQHTFGFQSVYQLNRNNYFLRGSLEQRHQSLICQFCLYIHSSLSMADLVTRLQVYDLTFKVLFSSQRSGTTLNFVKLSDFIRSHQSSWCSQHIYPPVSCIWLLHHLRLRYACIILFVH